MKLSIKAKLSISISCIVLVVLLLHMTLTYNITKDKLIEEMQQRMNVIAQQINISYKQSLQTSQAFEIQLAEKLYIASIYAADKLPAKVEEVTNEQLEKLCKELGIAHISLLHRSPDGEDIIIEKSSDLKEIGLSTRTWGYWYKAFEQMLNGEPVTVQEGQTMNHFWSGPFDVSTSSPEFMDKWGYYYDGKRDYIINPYIRDGNVDVYSELNKPDLLIRQTIRTQANVVEISALNPRAMEQIPKITLRSDGVQYIRQEDSRVLYGIYNIRDNRDIGYVREALAENKPLFYESNYQQRPIIKGFIPIQGTQSQEPYVLSVVMDFESLNAAVHDQLMRNIAIGVLLLEAVLICSYLFAGMIIKPIKSILNKVNMISAGQFDTQLNIERKDELGLLAHRINTMARNLQLSTGRLTALYEENREMKEHLESFINQSNDAIHVTDLQGQVKRVNQAFVDMFGWTEEEVVGRPLPTLPESAMEEERRSEAALVDGQSVSNRETTRLTKDGRLLDVSVSTSPIYDENGQRIAWASITRDMTSRKRMEELLRRSEKLTTVGQLAAGVAHEIRNPLTTLRGFLQLQQQTKRVNTSHVELMLSELERINLIVSEFLILAKPQAVRFQPKDVRLIMNSVLSLLDSQANLHNIEFVKRFDEDVPLVDCEENQLKQVFINIMKNAMEAMPGGGEIELIVEARGAASVIVIIKDYGIGIPAEDLSRLGDPFFTNKEKGTGLGLMVSQRIIHSHRGCIDITSELNRGTQVMVTLPAVDPSAPAGTASDRLPVPAGENRPT
ncbi:sensor histidine kinase [Paenibacillus dendritiformis]|uniref:sensor histidine kinase n=1 Tax=Paenibacillus dendritiformis TaxID=130049 RepID=UPI000DA7B453|nr:sensor histidine kinase [Paenibacillus dendritiformis]PZM63192.1 PAS domain-containing sensor histidine kinase [Paenibacillus dendritiformis]